VLAAAGHRCQFVDGHGSRCTTTTGLEAHHLRGLRQGGTNNPAANGVAVCRKHHRMVS
jgi:predicted restriction endonuclease